MAGLRKVRQKVALVSLDGPAKLTKFLKIDKKFNGKTASRKTGLWIEDLGIKLKKLQIKKAPRIGVNYAGKWAKKPYRLLLKKSFAHGAGRIG